MRFRKTYGESKVDRCPFCGKHSITNNSQGVPVCLTHKNTDLLDLKCACGDWLDILSGKFGPYFNCLKCGNISFSKGLEMNPGLEKKSMDKAFENKAADVPKKKFEKSEKKELVVTSDDVDLYYS